MVRGLSVKTVSKYYRKVGVETKSIKKASSAA